MDQQLIDEGWRIARLEHLDLKEDPFTLSADPRFLYLGTEHLAVYRQIQGVISRRRGLALIIGEMGMGKSSLARRVYDVYAPEESVTVCYIHTAAFKSAMDAARQIAHSLNISPQRSLTKQMDAIEKDMVEEFQKDKNVVVLLDDAQQMHRDSLQIIHRLYNFDYDRKVVQVLAFGQQELIPLFASDKAVNARVFVTSALPPLSLASALQMINFRLQVAGRQDPLLTDEAFDRLYAHSEGVPREIVRLCALATDRLLQTDRTLIDIDIANSAIAQAT